MLDRRDNVSQPHGDTCKWILELQQYRDWKEASCGLLWIKGKPGSGKSTLMSFLHRIFRRESDSEGRIHLDFFFHARGSELQHSRLGMIRSLLNQLLRQCPESSSEVLASYREKRAAYGSAAHSWEWQLPELERIFLDAVVESAAHRQVAIFVDALDEAGTEHARAVAKYLHKINDEVAHPQSGNIPLQLKTCISSRHYPVEPIAQSIEICMEDHNTHDIEDFVRHEIDQVRLTVNRPFIQSHWTQLTADILAHANGVFQWVRLVLQLVIEEFEQGWVIEDTSSFFENIPKDLTDIYAYILQSIMNQNRTQESLLLFQWVCQAMEPLTPQELMCALASAPATSTTRMLDPDLDEQSIERCIRSLSGGLIEVVQRTRGLRRGLDKFRNNSHTEIVQVIHQTVDEYIMAEGLTLLSSSREHGSMYWQPKHEHNRETLAQRCHSTLYWSCLEHLESLDYHTVTALCARMEIDPFRGSRQSFMQNLGTTYPLAVYAVMYIFVHASTAEHHRSTSKTLPDDSKHELTKFQRVKPVWNLIFGVVYDANISVTELAKSECLVHAAVYYNASTLVQYLIDCGEPFDQESAAGYTPLHLACERGLLEVCKILHSAGADLNMITSTNWLPLALAVSSGRCELVSWMLENGADVNPLVDGDYRPLQLAVKFRRISVVRLLVDAGADLNFYSRRGDTALEKAVYSGNLDIVKLLIDAGADVNFKGGYYGTALQAAVSARRFKAVELLLEVGANVNTKGGRLGTALQTAAYSGDCSIVKLLLDSGADVDIESGFYGTALQAAVAAGNSEVLELLLDVGADVNVKGGFYGTALHAAVGYRRLNMVNLLIDAGADVNVESGFCGTALHAAAKQGRSDICKQLIDAGADVNIKNDKGGTALQAAKSAKHKEAFQLLLDAGATERETLSISLLLN